MESQLKEVFEFLSNDSRPDIQLVTLKKIFELTGTLEVEDILTKNSRLLVSLVRFLKSSNTSFAAQSALVLINISSYNEGPQALININNFVAESDLHLADPVYTLLTEILNPFSIIADSCCMILSNMARSLLNAEGVLNMMEKGNFQFQDLLDVFTKINYNQKGQKLDYLGLLFSNLSQSFVFRKFFLNEHNCNIQKLLPFTEFKESITKRYGAVGTLRNCCFHSEYHRWLLSEEVDILPHLVLPLAGNATYDDEDNDKLPTQLQYLPEDKVREEYPEIRSMLLEAITQLCALKEGREYIRKTNIYVILRDLHTWETDNSASVACENLIEILIRDESDIGYDNLKEVEVPEEVKGAE